MKKSQWYWSIVLTAMLLFALLPVIANYNTNQNKNHSQETVKVDAPKQEEEAQPQGPETNSDGQPQDPAANPDDQPQQPPAPEPPPPPTYVWGIDTASKVDPAFLQCVKDNYGAPTVLGRYLETKEDISIGLTAEEAAFLHEQGIKILPIFNHFREAVGYENGAAEAKEAIAYAQRLGIPQGVTIFADIEPSYPVDDAFIQGWVDTLLGSPYKPGIYGVFTPDSKLSSTYQAAISKNKNVQDQTIIWSSNPDPGVTPQNQAPGFEPGAPENVNVSIWQYGIDGETCNIDTNLINSSVLGTLW